jgi:hypothetical protein
MESMQEEPVHSKCKFCNISKKFYMIPIYVTHARIIRVIEKLRKSQRDRVYGEESGFSEVTEPTKPDGEYRYHHDTTQAKRVETNFQTTSKKHQSTSTTIGKQATTTSTSGNHQCG